MSDYTRRMLRLYRVFIYLFITENQFSHSASEPIRQFIWNVTNWEMSSRHTFHRPSRHPASSWSLNSAVCSERADRVRLEPGFFSKPLKSIPWLWAVHPSGRWLFNLGFGVWCGCDPGWTRSVCVCLRVTAFSCVFTFVWSAVMFASKRQQLADQRSKHLLTGRNYTIEAQMWLRSYDSTHDMKKELC